MLYSPLVALPPPALYSQLALVAGLGWLCWWLGRKGAYKLPRASSGLRCWLRENSAALLFCMVLLPVILTGRLLSYPLLLLESVGLLLGLWLIMALLIAQFKQRLAVNVAAFVVYMIAALHWLDLWVPTVQTLRWIEIDLGILKLSVYSLIAGILILAAALWGTVTLSRFIERRIESIESIKPSARVLISKVLRISLILTAVLITTGSMGIDLTVLNFLGGGIGLGVGFGLQKVISNLFSGFILLADKSIKPGDVIEIESTYGWINNLHARYVSVITRDGTEHLIPNEDLITQRVVNWSFTDELVRVHLPIGVSYKSDIHLAQHLVLESMNRVGRILSTPEPRCLLIEFGDSSINFEARFWIADPQNGIGNIRSEVLFHVWDLFKEYDIEIPFPQRDIHIRTPEALPLRK